MSLSKSSLADCDASERGEGGGEEHAWMRISQGENGNREVHGKVGSKNRCNASEKGEERAGLGCVLDEARTGMALQQYCVPNWIARICPQNRSLDICMGRAVRSAARVESVVA